MDTESDNKRSAFGEIAFPLGGPEGILLYQWARFLLRGEEDDMEVADELKREGIKLGITQDQFDRALAAMKIVDKLFSDDDNNDNVAQS
ncbi:MAG TPA: hypothetical protein VJ227_01625 [Patescibacteria group bacterium]|nr:hypothetical protein [Patescibacteria group bacterium]